MKRRTYLKSTAGIGLLPFTETLEEEEKDSLQQNLERLFPPYIGEYERLRVDSERIIYTADSGGLMKVYNHRDGQEHLDVILDSIRYQAFSYGQASRLLSAYVQNVEYNHQDGDSVYSGDDWEVIYRYHTVEYSSSQVERVYHKDDFDFHPLQLAGGLVEWSVDEMWNIRNEFRAASEPFYNEWESEDTEWGTHYWYRNDEICFEYKDFDQQTLIVYTVTDGSIESLLRYREVESEREASQIYHHYRYYHPEYRVV